MMASAMEENISLLPQRGKGAWWHVIPVLIIMFLTNGKLSRV